MTTPAGEAMCAREESDGGGGDDAGAFHVGPAIAQAGGDGGGDPWAGFARVHAQQNHARVVMWTVELMREREPDSVDGLRIERSFPGNRANAISTKQLPHEILYDSSSDFTDARADPTASEPDSDRLAFCRRSHGDL